MMDQQALVRHLASAMGPSTDIEALFLGGSFGRGSADNFSDLDFVAVVSGERHGEVAAVWRGALEAAAPVVFWSARVGPPTLVNAVTQDWLRVDLWMVDRASFLDHAQSAQSVHAQSTLVPVIDPENLHASPPPRPPAPAANRRQVEYVVSEFIRVLGLIAVGMGRNELVLGVMGAGLLRDLLMRLMVEETHSPDRGGMLHLSRTVAREQMAELEALPCPGPRRAEILAAHWATARAFFPRARTLAAALDIPWPEAFEQATRAHLQRAFGAEFTPWW